MMGSNTYSDDFRQDAVAQITERGYLNGWNVPEAMASSRIGQMHNFSHLDGLIGFAVGIGVTARAAIRSRRIA